MQRPRPRAARRHGVRTAPEHRPRGRASRPLVVGGLRRRAHQPRQRIPRRLAKQAILHRRIECTENRSFKSAKCAFERRPTSVRTEHSTICTYVVFQRFPKSRFLKTTAKSPLFRGKQRFSECAKCALRNLRFDVSHCGRFCIPDAHRPADTPASPASAAGPAARRDYRRRSCGPDGLPCPSAPPHSPVLTMSSCSPRGTPATPSPRRGTAATLPACARAKKLPAWSSLSVDTVIGMQLMCGWWRCR